MRPWPDPDAPPRPAWRDLAFRLEAIGMAVLIAAALFLTIVNALAKPRVPRAGTAFTCHAIRVWDGDGPIWCAEGPRIRLANIGARELDNSCRSRRCPIMSGVAARDRLVAMLGGARGRASRGHVLVQSAPLSCRSRGPDRYGRTLATCHNTHGDLGDRLVAIGAARHWE